MSSHYDSVVSACAKAFRKRYKEEKEVGIRPNYRKILEEVTRLEFEHFGERIRGNVEKLLEETRRKREGFTKEKGVWTSVGRRGRRTLSRDWWKYIKR